MTDAARAIDILRTALEQADHTEQPLEMGATCKDFLQVESEPVAWKVAGNITNWSKDFSAYQTKIYVEPVYAHPLQREWQRLTAKDHEAFCIRSNLHPVIARAIAEYIEAKLKEKNT